MHRYCHGAAPARALHHHRDLRGHELAERDAFLLDRVERTVVRGPFRPFPRSATSALRGYGLSVLPKPPWFVTSRTGAAVCEGFTRFRIDGNWAAMSVVLVKAFEA